MTDDARQLAGEHLNAGDRRVRMAQRPPLGLAQQPPHEAGALFATDRVRPGGEQLVGQHRAVATEHDLGVGRVAPDERHHLAHLVEGRHDEVDADVRVVAGAELADQLAPRWIVQGHARRLDVLGDVVERPDADHLSQRKRALSARHLSVEQLRAYAIAFADAAERAAHTGQQHLRLHARDASPRRVSVASRRVGIESGLDPSQHQREREQEPGPRAPRRPRRADSTSAASRI